jgi:hypothetical protein
MFSPSTLKTTSILFAFTLSACGSDGVDQLASAGLDSAISAPIIPADEPVEPDPGSDEAPIPDEPSSAVVIDNPALTASAPVGTGTNSGGNAPATQDITYAPQPALMMDNVSFDPSAKQAHIRVYLTSAPPTTVIARVFTKNGSGTNYMYSGGHYTTTKQTVIFRPGDPLEQTVAVPIKKAKEGGHFRAYVPSVPSGAKRGTQSITLTAVKGAVNNAIAWKGRAPRTFAPAGPPSYALNINAMKWSADGGAGVWRTALAHGRAQPANAETGLYLDPEEHRSAEAPIRIENGHLVLHSQRLNNAISYAGLGNGAGAGAYKYGAVALTGLKNPETHIRYGQIEWQAKMPDRRGSWPALWLVGVQGWPPEIDVYEGFNSNASFDPARMASGTIHGGPNGTRLYARGYSEDVASIYGIKPTLTTDFHSYAVDIQPDYITWFVDGVEVFQAVNKFNATFYPIMNVAVKTSGNYSDGSGDMVIRSLRMWQRN